LSRSGNDNDRDVRHAGDEHNQRAPALLNNPVMGWIAICLTEWKEFVNYCAEHVGQRRRRWSAVIATPDDWEKSERVRLELITFHQ
jgi:phage-related protein